MPVRNVATAALARHQTGGLSFNTIKDVAYLGPLKDRREIPMDDYYREFDDAFVAVVEAIDWNRVMLEATTRHLALKHQNEFEEYGDEVCPECLCEALLAPSWQDWQDRPKAERSRR